MYTYSFSIPLTSTGDIISATLESITYISDVTRYKNVAFLRKVIHSKTIRPRYRIMLLNSDETVKEQVPNEDILSGGSYSENYQNGQRRSLSFTLNNETGKYTPSIFSIWKGTRFSFEIGIEIPDSNETIVWFKKGIFVVKSASPSRGIEQKTVSVECTDKFGFLEDKSCTFSTSVTINPGVDIKSIIEDTLMEDRGNGIPVDVKKIIYDSNLEGKNTPLTITEGAGSTYASILLQLADILSAEIFYNSEGNLTLIPFQEVIQDTDKPVADNYVDVNGDYKNNDFSFDFSSIVNRIVVIGSNVNGSVCMAEKRNDDPASPLYFGRIGLATEIINDSNITSKNIAEERAEYELRKKIVLNTAQSSTVMFNPLLSVNQIVTYTDDFYDTVRERFVIQSISYSIGYEGTMSISTSNVNNLPFVA